jgi:hypothetical protein
MACGFSTKLRACLSTGLLAAAALAWPSHAQERAATIPNFAGLWARMTFGAEPPASGPGPLVNLMHRGDGAFDGGKLVGDYNNPILKPAAAAEVKRQGEISKTGNAFPDPSNQCAPQQPPFILRQQEIQLLQEKDRVTILYMLDHHVRQVRLNASHPQRVTPSWSGDSIGHYEGDTLVVDTVGIKPGRVSMSDQYGSPQSEAMHVVERYRLVDAETAERAFAQNEKEYGRADGPVGNGVFIDFDDKGKGLQLQFKVEDPNVFTTPWSATVTYRKAGSQWQEQVCAENTFEYYAAKETAVPRANRSDF